MEDDDIALAADARRLVLDQEDIGRRVREGVADELMESGMHVGRMPFGMFRTGR